jgi:hypothetical protein
MARCTIGMSESSRKVPLSPVGSNPADRYNRRAGAFLAATHSSARRAPASHPQVRALSSRARPTPSPRAAGSTHIAATTVVVPSSVTRPNQSDWPVIALGDREESSRMRDGRLDDVDPLLVGHRLELRDRGSECVRRVGQRPESEIAKQRPLARFEVSDSEFHSAMLAQPTSSPDDIPARWPRRWSHTPHLTASFSPGREHGGSVRRAT